MLLTEIKMLLITKKKLFEAQWKLSKNEIEKKKFKEKSLFYLSFETDINQFNCSHYEEFIV